MFHMCITYLDLYLSVYMNIAYWSSTGYTFSFSNSIRYSMRMLLFYMLKIAFNTWSLNRSLTLALIHAHTIYPIIFVVCTVWFICDLSWITCQLFISALTSHSHQSLIYIILCLNNSNKNAFQQKRKRKSALSVNKNCVCYAAWKWIFKLYDALHCIFIFTHLPCIKMCTCNNA